MVHLLAFEHRGRRLLQATLEDITQRKKTEEALRESRQLLQSVLENSPAVIYAKRKDGSYTYINREWERVCDLTREQVVEQLDETVAECIGAAAEDGISADDLKKAAGGSLKEYLRTAIINTSE